MQHDRYGECGMAPLHYWHRRRQSTNVRARPEPADGGRCFSWRPGKQDQAKVVVEVEVVEVVGVGGGGCCSLAKPKLRRLLLVHFAPPKTPRSRANRRASACRALQICP